MSPEQVFQKTDKGREEIAKRTFRLEARRRTLLILVDGHSDAASLAEKTAHMGDGIAQLQTLWSDGFIEPAGEALAAAPAGSTPIAGRETGPGSLEQLKRKACAEIERLMGPDGVGLALRIERTTTHAEYLAEARKASAALNAFLGPRKGEEFARTMGL